MPPMQHRLKQCAMQFNFDPKMPFEEICRQAARRLGHSGAPARDSPRVNILFDIYHVQTMDGDVVRNIRNYFPSIAHFPTGDAPGRHEIDDTQELNYRFFKVRTTAKLSPFKEAILDGAQ
jgi:hypothetical protein